LYVLIPVLDDEKHYYVDEAEVEKLLRHGQGWLAGHPAKNLISRRYLAHKQSLARLALSRLVDEDPDDIEEKDERLNLQEEAVERPLSLNEQRMKSVLAVLQKHEVRSVVDLGCGEGRYLKELFEQKQFDLVAGMDVSPAVLEKAHDRLRLERLPERLRERVSLFQGSLMYRDERLRGFDAAICIEVIEHMELSRLPSFEHTVFHFAAPELVVISTPNFEYNRKFENLPSGKFRHGDHRFEWTREQFEFWAKGVAERCNYQVYFEPIGPVDTECGAPTQMAVFSRHNQPLAAGQKGDGN
jgi:3' terminal RNA ribose 2'-O-methyltransferase Hen1